MPSSDLAKFSWKNAEIDGRNADKKADLKRINAAGKHLLSLVTDVLDLSKIESNFIELKIEKFDLDEIPRDRLPTFSRWCPRTATSWW